MEVLSAPRGSNTSSRGSNSHSSNAVKTIVATAAAAAAAAESGGPLPLLPSEQSGELSLLHTKEDSIGGHNSVDVSASVASGGKGGPVGEAGDSSRLEVVEGGLGASSQQQEEAFRVDGGVGAAGLQEQPPSSSRISIDVPSPSTSGKAAAAALAGVEGEEGPGHVSTAAAAEVGVQPTDPAAVAAVGDLESNPATTSSTTAAAEDSTAVLTPPSPPPTPPPSVAANLQLGERSASPSRQPGATAKAGDGGGPTSGNVWERLGQSEILEEIKALYSEACNWYKKKGGAMPLQVRFVQLAFQE